MKQKYIVNKASLKQINITLLKPSPYNTFDVNDTADLEGSLLSCGLLTPLSVIGPDDNGEYQILAGERRHKAMVNINKSGRGAFSKVPCYIVGNSEMDKVSQRLLIESANLETRDFNKDEHRFQIIRLLKEMADEGNISHENIIQEAGKYMSISDRYRRMYLQIFENGNVALRTLVKNKRITVTEASKVSHFDDTIQEKIVDDIEHGTNPKEAIVKYAEPVAKRGRKKKEESQSINLNEEDVHSMARKKKQQTEDIKPQEDKLDDTAIIEALMSGAKGETIDNDMLSKAFSNYASDIDLTCDTTGEISKLKRIEKVEPLDSNEESSVNFVIKWCERMMKKKHFSDEEYEALDSIKELIEYIGFLGELEE